MKAGSLQPENEPSFMKPKDPNSSSLKANFKQDSEALYEHTSFASPSERLLQETVDRYNIVNDYLNTIHNDE